MSEYTQTTDFSVKDALTTGDAAKKILGSEVDVELAAIATAIASKSDDNAVVHDTGTETVAGDKTFSGNNTHSGTNAFSGNNTHTGTVTMTGKSTYWAKGGDLASADPLGMDSDGNYFDVTGTTTIASYTVPAGMLFMLQFDGVLQLTHHATNNNLPGGANITTAAGDRLIGFATAANAVHVVDYIRASGRALVDTISNDTITQAMMGDSAVGQAELKTTTGEVSTSAASALLTLPGGEYGFYPQVRITLGAGGTLGRGTIAGFDEHNFTAIGASYLTRISLGTNSSASGEVVHAKQRYVQSSPPYESYRAGDPVPLFTFAAIHKTTGAVVMAYVAADPPWANNGPTKINPRGRVVDLARSRLATSLKGERSSAAQLENDLSDLYAFMRAPENAKIIADELARPATQELKNADMTLVPHPFLGNDLSDYQIVVINPTDDVFCRALAARHDYLGDSVVDILHGAHLIIDNIPMPGLGTPPGVMAVRARWKLTP
jgi:hypothetical protein